MKKISLRIPATLLSLLMLAACSQDAIVDEPDVPADGTMPSVEINLDLGVNSGLLNGFGASRVNPLNTAPRELLSFDNAQCVTDLRIYVFRADKPDGEYLYVGGGTDYLGVPTSDGGYLVSRPGVFNDTIPRAGEFERHSYVFNPRLTAGFYKFLAVGRGDLGLSYVDRYEWKRQTYEPIDFEVGTTSLSEANLVSKMNYAGNLIQPQFCHEIFSGMLHTDGGNEDYIEVSETKEGQSFYKRIELTRVVAGLYAAFNEIPSEYIDIDKYRRLLSEGATPKQARSESYFGASNINIVLSEGAVELSLANGEYNTHIYKDVIVGSMTFAGTKYGNWSSGKYMMRDIFIYKGVEIPANTALISNFMLPVASLTSDGQDKTSLYIHIFKMDQTDFTDIRERRIPVKMQAYIDENGNKVDISSGDPYKFPITANCIYAIGTLDNPVSLAKYSGMDENGNVILPDSDMRSRAAEDELSIPITVYASEEAYRRATR